jgi:glucose/mannose-6-phosphate isomerase
VVDLDDQRIHEHVDQAGMRLYLRQLPQQCRRAWQQVTSFLLPQEYSAVNKVVILGMGGSAIGGELLRGLCIDTPHLAVSTHRDYGLPGFVDERTLVIASSSSGTTEETLDAFFRALSNPCKKLAITTGGKLGAMAQEHEIPLFLLDCKAPPRAALGCLFVPLLGILQKLGLIHDISDELDRMVKVLDAMVSRLSEDVPLSSNKAKHLSTQLFERVPVIYGAGTLSPVAHRWKTQLNENSKHWSFSEVLPDLNHNSVVGYDLPRKMKEIAFVIILRSPSLHQRHLDRYQVTLELLEKAGVKHGVVDA